jgi:hypothetical protein
MASAHTCGAGPIVTRDNSPSCMTVTMWWLERIQTNTFTAKSRLLTQYRAARSVCHRLVPFEKLKNECNNNSSQHTNTQLL